MARIVGKAGVRGKGERWAANHEVHGAVIEGPYVNGDQRITMDEVRLYTLKDGLIAEEQFFYGGLTGLLPGSDIGSSPSPVSGKYSVG